jgi:hypothetical protein
MVMRAAAALCAGAVASALGGCTLITDSFLTNDFSGDPYPINIDTSTGAIVVGMRPEGLDDATERDAVLDLLSPITVIDPGLMKMPSIAFADLTLLGDATAGSATRVPRARFVESQLVSIHPCAEKLDDGTPNPDCIVGASTMSRPFKAIIGADTLAGDAVRLRLGDNQIFVLADVGGSDRGRSFNCDAVFDSPYRGGGTLVFPTTELAFGNRRITLQSCLGPDPAPDPSPLTFDSHAVHQRGADALFVVSTSIGISILGAAAYERYRLAKPEVNPPALDALPMDSVYLPSGTVTGRRATIDRLALVATSSSNALAPCRQVYAHRLLSNHVVNVDRECVSHDGLPPELDCPCKDGSEFCAVPAILELTPSAGLDVLVVDDTDATLQALRTELRPDQPEVDGILGTNALRDAEIDVDYPHDRLLARCRSATCSARPELAQRKDRCQINRCIAGFKNALGCPDVIPEVTPPD